MQGNNGNATIHLPSEQEPYARGIKRYRSSSPTPPTPQRPVPMENRKQDVQPSITLGRTWIKMPEDMSQRDNLQRPYKNYKIWNPKRNFQTSIGKGRNNKCESRHYPSHRRPIEPEREYSDSFRLTGSGKVNQLPSGFTPLRIQKFSGKRSPFFTIPGCFQEKTRIQKQKNNFFQPEAEGVRPNDTESVEISERSEKEPEIAVYTAMSSCYKSYNCYV
ncbi:hypothetical protein O181_014930 [Austropuccinia psidii MF-1]|uniref:Uncharacterized protein n=1 Tax=Austropuccinia psidii MF-1 TaxID=1389203 RepID=A0A9Q3C2V0_9BASI|nr:hypothetical protein [Austropuccinia psidii MF-1]